MSLIKYNIVKALYNRELVNISPKLFCIYNFNYNKYQGSIILLVRYLYQVIDPQLSDLIKEIPLQEHEQ